MLQTSLLLMKSLNNTVSHFLSILCSLFPKVILSIFILLHCSWCSCRVAAIKRIPVHRHSADYICHFLWDYWAHCRVFENGVLLMYTLEGVSSVANFITAYEESQ